MHETTRRTPGRPGVVPALDGSSRLHRSATRRGSLTGSVQKALTHGLRAAAQADRALAFEDALEVLERGLLRRVMDGSRATGHGARLASEARRELGERQPDLITGGHAGAEFVVAASEVLDECGSGGDRAQRRIVFSPCIVATGP